MIKKAFIVYLLLLAYTCVLVHNLIPHHHHPFTATKHHHHQGKHHSDEPYGEDHHAEEHQDQDGDTHKNATDHLFAYHQHATPDSQMEHVVTLSEKCHFQGTIHSIPLSFFYFHCKPPKIPDEPLNVAYITCIPLSFYPSSCSLRAPPALLS